MTANSSNSKTFERNVEERRYTVTYIEPSFDEEEKERKMAKHNVERKLYDIFAKYYEKKKQ